jgi:hypothetical protein
MTPNTKGREMGLQDKGRQRVSRGQMMVKQGSNRVEQGLTGSQNPMFPNSNGPQIIPRLVPDLAHIGLVLVPDWPVSRLSLNLSDTRALELRID